METNTNNDVIVISCVESDDKNKQIENTISTPKTDCDNNIITLKEKVEKNINDNNNYKNYINIMFYTLDIKFKRDTFGFLKEIYNLNYLCDKIKQIRNILTKREFIYKLKIYGNNKKYEPLKKCYSYWVTFINKKNILESLKIYKLKKKNQQYQDLVNKNKIILALKKKQQEVNLLNKKKLILIKIINLKIKKIENIISKYFNHWKKIVFTKNIGNINNSINDMNINKNNNVDKSINGDDDKNKSNNITKDKIINTTNEKINCISEDKSKIIPNMKRINVHIQISGNKKNNINNNNKNINNINNNINNNIKKDNSKERSVSKKKRIVKRNNYRTKYNQKSETKSRRIINRKETLKNAIYNWKRNAKKLSIIEDYKFILKRIKKQNKIMGDKTNNEQKLINLNIDLLNKLKKVSLHLLLSIYQKSLTNLIYKYFNIWKSNTNMKKSNNNINAKNNNNTNINNNNQNKNRNKKLIKQISKYVRKKVGSCYKQKEKQMIPNQKMLINSNSPKNNGNKFNDTKNINNIYARNNYDIINNNDNNIIKTNFNDNIVKKRPEKTFSKKKTKLNLYKDRINRYKDENNIKKSKEKNVPKNNINNNNNNNILFNDYNYIIDNYNCNTNTNSNSNIEIPNEFSSPNRYILIETNSDNNSKNKNKNILSPDNYISNILTTNTESKYVIRKPKKRTASQPKIKKINLNDPELMGNKTPPKHISKSGEKNIHIYRNNNDLLNLNSYMENLISKTDYSFQYPCRSRNDKKDKNIEPNLNIKKDTQSSHEESSCNHITLIEESNEVKKPMDYINTPNYERQIKKNLNQYFSPTNELSNSSLPHNYLLTDSRIKKNLYQQNQNYMPNYDEDLLGSRTYISRTNIKQFPPHNSFTKSPFTQYGKNLEKMQDSNIYLEPNEEEEINIIPNLKKSYNANRNVIMNNNYGNNKTQYYNNSFLRDHNKNNLKKTNNSLYERMQERKKNPNNYSPYSRNVNRDNNKVRITYNQFDFSGNEDYNNTYNNENETTYNNYNNLKPIFY